jgi:hypothetical protein
MSHHQDTSSPCRFCGKHESEDQKHTGGICHGCLAKIGIVILIIMIIGSYMVWFGLI